MKMTNKTKISRIRVPLEYSESRECHRQRVSKADDKKMNRFLKDAVNSIMVN